MADQRLAKLGSDTLERGMPISTMIKAMEAMGAAGMSSKPLTDSQAVLVVEGGVGLEATSIGSSFVALEGAIAVFMEPGSVASVRRSGAKTMHVIARIDSGMDWEAGDTCPYGPKDLEKSRSGMHPMAAQWLESDQRGASSESLCRQFFNVPPASSSFAGEHPHDPADLLRCVRFLEFTGTAGRIGEAASISPEWAKIVHRWDELTTTLAEELALGSKAPRTFEAMQSLLAPPRAPKAGF